MIDCTGGPYKVFTVCNNYNLSSDFVSLNQSILCLAVSISIV